MKEEEEEEEEEEESHPLGPTCSVRPQQDIAIPRLGFYAVCRVRRNWCCQNGQATTFPVHCACKHCSAHAGMTRKEKGRKKIRGNQTKRETMIACHELEVLLERVGWQSYG
jgi:hypothetical protein